MASLETLKSLTRLQRQSFRVLEPKEVRGMVSPLDLVRLDEHNRTIVCCPAGTEPPSWLELSNEEKAALVPADEVPKAKVHATPFGFNPEDVASGRVRVRGLQRGPRDGD